jgi:hypothetical protein
VLQSILNEKHRCLAWPGVPRARRCPCAALRRPGHRPLLTIAVAAWSVCSCPDTAAPSVQCQNGIINMHRGSPPLRADGRQGRAARRLGGLHRRAAEHFAAVPGRSNSRAGPQQQCKMPGCWYAPAPMASAPLLPSWVPPRCACGSGRLGAAASRWRGPAASTAARPARRFSRTGARLGCSRLPGRPLGASGRSSLLAVPKLFSARKRPGALRAASESSLGLPTQVHQEG